MKRFLISPPFGNWLQSDDCTSVLGSFTWDARPGLLYHTLRSFRPVRGGWRNQIGLRNKGIRSINKFDPSVIYSLVGLNDGDWERMLEYIGDSSQIMLEINLGCPNVHRYGIEPNVLREYCKRFGVIAKLPATDAVDEIAAMCIESGVTFLHLCNTLPTPKGGISGQQLFQVNLPIVSRLAKRYPFKIIAGGGIYTTDNLMAYEQAGATYFSLSTVFLTPWRVKNILFHY